MDAGVSDMDVEESKVSVEEGKPKKVSRRRTAEYVWNRIPRDPYWALPKYFHIRTKLAERVKLEPNACQRLIIDAYLRQLKAGKPIRLIILKPRQTGSSTVCEALTYGRTATQRDVESVLIAHDLDGAQNLMQISNLFYADFPEEYRPNRRWSNRKELYFDVSVNPVTGAAKQGQMQGQGLNSRLRIETARDVNAGIGHTIQNIHCTEFARWPNAEEAWFAIYQCVPHTPNSMIIIESTAKGVGNLFHRMWDRAKEGEGDFEPIFIPWYIHEEYMMPVDREFKRTYEEVRVAQELVLDTKFGQHITNQKLAWRRWCIFEKCDGDIDKFHQDYPATDSEAFISSGANVFNFPSLRDFYRPIATAVKNTYYILKDEKGEELYKVKEHRGEVFYDDKGKVRFEENPRGHLRVYRGPKPGKTYVISCDPAEGLAGRDYTVIQVLDQETREQCAVWRGYEDPDLVADILTMLGTWYNMAWVVPERNQAGIAVLMALRKRYQRVYKETRIIEGTLKTEWGWYTSKNKAGLVSVGQAAIRKQDAMIYDARTVEELIHFTRNDDGKMQGQGMNDDCVMSWLIALRMCEVIPRWQEAEAENEPPSDLARLFVELTKPVREQNRRIIAKGGKKEW